MGQPSDVAVKLAAPTRIGPVSGLTASATKPGQSYSVTAAWNSLNGATAYEVSMSHAGTLLAKTKVTQPRWTGETRLPAASTLTIKVVPFASKRRGQATSTSVVLPDLTAPVGQYNLALDRTTATFTEESLSDDVTPRDQIVRSIDWGMGDGWEAWPTGQAISFTYPELGLWKPRVLLVDQAGNSREVALQTVVTGDYTAPSGTYTTTPQRAWAEYTRVVLSQTSLTDNLSAPEDVVRWVDWKDGSAPTQWTAGTTLRHVYPTGGSFTPSVRLVDDAGNEVVVDSAAVTVAVDAAAPRVRVAVPKRRAAYVRSWKTLKGAARDGVGTGVRKVLVRVVEKRGSRWYAYRAPGKRWVRAGSTRASAMRQTRPAVATWKAGRWSTQVARLRRGTIVVKVTATDRVGNTSKPVFASKRLTR